MQLLLALLCSCLSNFFQRTSERRNRPFLNNNNIFFTTNSLSLSLLSSFYSFPLCFSLSLSVHESNLMVAFFVYFSYFSLNFFFLFTLSISLFLYSCIGEVVFPLPLPSLWPCNCDCSCSLTIQKRVYVCMCVCVCVCVKSTHSAG